MWAGNQGIPILTTEFLADWLMTCSLIQELDDFLFFFFYRNQLKVLGQIWREVSNEKLL